MIKNVPSSMPLPPNALWQFSPCTAPLWQTNQFAGVDAKLHQDMSHTWQQEETADVFGNADPSV